MKLLGDVMAASSARLKPCEWLRRNSISEASVEQMHPLRFDRQLPVLLVGTEMKKGSIASIQTGRFRLARSDCGKWVVNDIFVGIDVSIDQNLIREMDRAGFDDVVDFLNHANPQTLHVVALEVDDASLSLR